MSVQRAPSQNSTVAPIMRNTDGRGLKIYAASLLVVLVCLAYANTLQVPLQFDDVPSISTNESIKHLATAFSPPKGGEPVTGRPVLNATFALNYALSGLSLPGFHVTNILIHALATLTLFGIIRRTLDLPLFSGKFSEASRLIAWFSAAIWALHPLQTESVTYIAQRAESLVGLFYLLTLYGYIRSAEPNSSRGWKWFTWIACLAGMGTKEVMATAPFIVLLYDRIFLHSSIRESWRQNRHLFLALASTWLFLGYLVVVNSSRNGTIGGSTDVTWWNYLFTQSYAIARYLFLAVIPSSLTFDYGILIVKDAGTLVPCGALVLLLLAATIYGLVRQPRWGVFGAWFFLILAPTTSVIPVNTQTVSEHRMYLPLAAIIISTVLLIWKLRGRSRIALLALLLVAAGIVTWQRNLVYGSTNTLWEDTVAKRPKNARALNNLGMLYGEQKRYADAIALFSQVVVLDPKATEINYNLAFALTNVGRDEDAVKYFEAAIAAKPTNIEARANFGAALLRLGRVSESIEQNEAARRLNPRRSEVYHNLGLAYARLGQPEKALGYLRESVRLSPDDSGYLITLIRMLDNNGHGEEAIPLCEHYLKDHASADYFTFLGVLQARRGQLEKARDAFLAALRLDPANNEATQNLTRANALLEKTSSPSH